MLRPSLASLVILGSFAIAHAQDAPPPTGAPMLPTMPGASTPEPEKPLLASITISPVHFALPVGELTAEFKLAPKFGVAVIGGVGTVTPENSNDSVFVYEIGVSPRVYVIGDFRQGVELGVEALYLHANADDQFMASVSAQGLAIGPYAGYKWVSQLGLTLEAQLGGSYLTARGESSTATNESSDFIVLLNLQVGWSF
jgi:hypothetical protein